MNEILDSFDSQKPNTPKERHGCVTVWLVLMIISNGLIALSYLFFGNTIADFLPNESNTIYIIMLGLIAILNIIFAIMILQWKKMGFFGFVATSIAALFLNSLLGLDLLQSLLGLSGIAILYGILQIKGKNGNSAWSGMD